MYLPCHLQTRERTNVARSAVPLSSCIAKAGQLTLWWRCDSCMLCHDTTTHRHCVGEPSEVSKAALRPSANGQDCSTSSCHKRPYTDATRTLTPQLTERTVGS